MLARKYQRVDWELARDGSDTGCIRCKSTGLTSIQGSDGLAHYPAKIAPTFDPIISISQMCVADNPTCGIAFRFRAQNQQMFLIALPTIEESTANLSKLYSASQNAGVPSNNALQL